jgi:ATPase subunit of ABC transporter with duplicated ATPase domains
VQIVLSGRVARVSLATALLGELDLLVLDEPTAGLDPVLRRDLWEYGATLAGYVAAVAGFTLLALVLGALTLRRRST